MRRHSVAAVLGTLVLAALPTAALGAVSHPLLETLTITTGGNATTSTQFKHDGNEYVIVSGTMVDRTVIDKFDKDGKKIGERIHEVSSDPLYAYDCSDTESDGCDQSAFPSAIWDLLTHGQGGYTDGGQINNFTESGQLPPYNSSHSYQIPIDYATGPLEFSNRDDTRTESSYSRTTQTGSYTVSVYGGCSGDDCLKIEWEMVSRYGEKNDIGVIKPLTSREDIDPEKGFDVLVKVKRHKHPCTGKEKYRIKVDDKPQTLTQRERRKCAFTLQMKEGDRDVVVTGTINGKKVNGNETIQVQDWLIVGLGDSIGSGEGNPDLPKGAGLVWQNPQCHRSEWSYQARTAQRLEAHDDHTSVTFVHLACSGAAIARGLLGGYEGIEEADDLPPQISEMRKLVGDREIDAVIVSIGANDLKFGGVLLFCAKYSNCQDRKYKNDQTLDYWLGSRFDVGEPHYERVSRALESVGVPLNRAFLVQYPDPLREADGTTFCGEILDSFASGIDALESRWTFKSFLTPLNLRVASQASIGWNVVRGAQQSFAKHGYCADDDARWMVQFLESRKFQGDTNGTMHPNNAGHVQLMRLVTRELFPKLYPGGKPRPPAVSAG